MTAPGASHAIAAQRRSDPLGPLQSDIARLWRLIPSSTALVDATYPTSSRPLRCTQLLQGAMRMGSKSSPIKL
jgi:hypothetical protein